MRCNDYTPWRGFLLYLGAMLRFGPSVFLSAFLLFLVQPLIARYILPWFGGTSSVWTVCMLFFQCALLAGYAYSHLSTSRLAPRTQWMVHAAVLLAAALTLPITPSEALKPAGGENPTLRVLALLLASAGLPYFALSATGPLLQAWFATRSAASPYPLYALSNAGSLLALLCYPFAVEPWLGRAAQAWGWSIAFAVCGVLCLVAGWRTPGEKSAGAPAATATGLSRLLWVALPCCACMVLLAATNQLCQDVANVPFLWVLPLGLYLLTFIIAFTGPRAYWRWPMMACMAAAVTAVFYALEAGASASFAWQLLAYGSGVFFCCMVCHGELYRLRPAAGGLTGFYLAISAGGALGGVLVGLVAPLVFHTFLELPLALAACVLLGLAATLKWLLERVSLTMRRQAGLGAVCILLAVGLIVTHHDDKLENTVLAERNFYGVLRLREFYASSEHHQYSLYHGSIEHGFQYLRPEMKRLPTSYYAESSGVGLTLNALERKPRAVGVVGLGTGTLATYGKPGDHFVFYEINEAVVKIARDRFTYLQDSAAEIEIVLGDARLALEREEARKFDVLVLDAFSSDSIPVHLLTLEAMETYRRHLAPDGVICVHVSNRHLNLKPVVKAMAGDWPTRLANTGEDLTQRIYTSEWIMITRNKRMLSALDVIASPLPPLPENFRAWTDDYSNLFSVLEER